MEKNNSFWTSYDFSNLPFLTSLHRFHYWLACCFQIYVLLTAAQLSPTQLNNYLDICSLMLIPTFYCFINTEHRVKYSQLQLLRLRDHGHEDDRIKFTLSKVYGFCVLQTTDIFLNTKVKCQTQQVHLKDDAVSLSLIKH